MVRKPGMPDPDEKAGGSDPGTEHLPVLARPGTTTPRAHKRAQVALAAGIATLVALIGALWLLDNRGSDTSSPTASDTISEQRGGGGNGDDGAGGADGSASTDGGGGTGSGSSGGGSTGGGSTGGSTSGADAGSGSGGDTSSSGDADTPSGPDDGGSGPSDPDDSGTSDDGGGRRGPRTTEASAQAATVINIILP